MTPALYVSDLEVHKPLHLGDLQDEIEHSRVYNPGTKKSLIGVCVHIMRLAVAMTGALVAVWPNDDLPQFYTSSHEDWYALDKSKAALKAWLQQASQELEIPEENCTPRSASSTANTRDLSNEFTHDSVLLFTNLAYLIYW